jgi:hypothetical protein
LITDDEPARVFISCGQRPDEIGIAERVAKILEKLRLEAYVALTDQRLRSVPENIFERLRNTEYFLFIDFCREKIDNQGDEPEVTLGR